MGILKHIWRWWRFVCVALVTTFIILFLLTAVIERLKGNAPDAKRLGECLDQGGTWNDDLGECRTNV